MEMFLSVRNGVEYFSQRKTQDTIKTLVVEPTEKHHDEKIPLGPGYVIPIDYFYDNNLSDRVIVIEIQ